MQAVSETNVLWSVFTHLFLMHLHLSLLIVSIKVDRHLSHTSQPCFHTIQRTLPSRYDASHKILKRAASPAGSGNGVIRRILTGWSTDFGGKLVGCNQKQTLLSFYQKIVSLKILQKILLSDNKLFILSGLKLFEEQCVKQRQGLLHTEQHMEQNINTEQCKSHKKVQKHLYTRT